VYGLGVTIYELLTLEPAFDSPDRLQLIQQVTHGDPRRPRKLDSRIPRDLETIVSKAIDKEPTRRYASAADMAADLQRFLADRPIFARRSAVWERTWRLCRRNPIVSGLTAAVVALAAVLGATALVMQLVRTQRDRAIVHLDRAIEAERLANVNLARAERAEREVRIRSHLTQAVAHRRRGEMGRRVHSVREIDLALGLATDPSPELKHELRNELIANLALTDLWPAKTWEAAGTKMEMDAAFEKYARATLDGVVSVRRVADDSEIIRLERPPISDARISLKFSRDGRYLATFSYDHKLLVCQLDGGRTVVIPGCNSEQAYDFTPDSRRIICGQGDELIVYDLVTGAAESHWPTKIAPWCVVTSPVGEMVAISSHPDGRPHMQVHSSLTGQLISQWAPPAGLYSMVWRPDGKVLGLGRQDGTLSLWDVEQAKPQREIKQVGKYAALAFSHGGDLLASYSSGTVRLWEPMSGNVLMAGTVGMRSLRFSSDDRYLGLFDDGAKVGIFEVLRSDIHRHVARGIGDRDGNPISASFNRDGDLFAVGTPNGFGLWDFASGRQLAHAPIGYVEQMWFEDSGDLVTASKGPSAHILNRWPVRREQGEGRCVKVGPPKQLPMLSPNICSATRDGRVIATAVTDGAMVYYSDRPQEPIKIGPHWDCRNVAVSPDGQWVATGSHWGAKVKVWRARTAELVATLPIETSSWVHFSPDGRWLTTTGGGCRIWKVPSWEEGPAIDGGVAVFSPDGTLLVTNRYHALRLIHPDTGREIVRLEDPNGSVAWQYAFTHDGTSLFAITNSTCWDLRRIREELTARNLDFDLPPYAPRVLGARVTDQVDLTWAHDVKGSAEEQMRLAIEQYRRNYESSPNNPNACNNLAWFLVTAPEPLRDVELAVRLSEKAATANTSPFKSTYRNTLGVAYYRSGRYEEAASCLEANLADQSDSDLPYDLFFLAMSHQQLGHTARARELFIMAKRWFTREMQRDTLSHQQIEELTRFCSEAELVLGAAPARLESP
jgi:WD40 repeat protein